MKRHKAPRVKLQPNVQKILAAITHVIALADEDGEPVTQYYILKSIFCADKAHLNKYGRPITFDNYVAMGAGPVPSLTYDLLKEKMALKISHKIGTFPWDRTPSAGGIFYYSKANTIPYQDILSDSDKKALLNAYKAIGSLTFSQIKKLTHEDPAYIEAWEDEGNKKSFNMSIGMLFDSPDFDQAENVEFLSKHA